MKHLIMKSTLFLSAAVAMTFSAYAQSVKVSIPFPFEANGKSLPAGDYVVHATSTPSGIYAMRNLDTKESALLMGIHSIANPEGMAKLVFEKAIDGYYLTEVWTGDGARAVRSPRGRNSILASTKPATVVIAGKK